ncbi:MAG: Ig-like domain repeat protein [Edaphobacter sp.]
MTEPVFPVTCAVLQAPLQSTMANGPSLENSLAVQDAESLHETMSLDAALTGCHAGQAVELTLGTDSSHNAFLLNPITVPANVSLIIDGGVTVFGSRDPANYQDPNYFPPNSSVVYCGTYGPYPENVGCVALFTLTDNSGIYGYGVIDGQGNQPLLSGRDVGLTWWNLTENKVALGYEQANPYIIRQRANNLTLYKITIRNPPYHTVDVGVNGTTVWGVKVQAPWNIPNSDGFDLHGANITVYDSTVADGDQDIAIITDKAPVTNVTIDHFTMYGKDGIAILGNGDGTVSPISHLLAQNVLMTGDVPSLAGTTVNGVPESTMMAQYGLQSYTQALPNGTTDLHGLQIIPQVNNPSKPGGSVLDVTFRSVCMQDIEKALNIVPEVPPAGPNYPAVSGITFQDIHFLKPTVQFPSLVAGLPTDPQGSGTYKVFFEGVAPNYINQVILNNVVFDDIQPDQSSVSLITATGNLLSTVTNVYPSVLNDLTAPVMPDPSTPMEGNTQLILNGNAYAAMTSTSDRGQAYDCKSSLPLPFLLGDLYLSQGGTPGTGSATNLQSITLTQGGSVTLNAVVQPAMSQTTHFARAGVYPANPGLLSIGSPALTNPVNFYEGTTLLGSGSLSANGTLATLTLNNVSAGTHTYTAQYPADAYYATFNFGSVTVQGVPPASTTTKLSTSATSGIAGDIITLTAVVAPVSGSGMPTGAATFMDGTAMLGSGAVSATGVAIFTTQALAAGSHSFTSVYNGDSNFVASTSSAVIVTIAPPPVPDFSLAMNPNAGVVTRSIPNTATLMITPVNGFNTAVTFGCSGLPVGISCNFSPTMVTPSGTAAISTVVTFTASGGSAMMRGSSLVVLSLSFGGWLLAHPRRRLRACGFWVAVLAAALYGISGCGSNNTVPVISAVTVTATSESISHATTYSLVTSK